jgi:hypothetical protein
MALAQAGHFASASCTRFSPKSRWPAGDQRPIASAGWVLETAIRVTSAASRPASAAALAIRARDLAAV